MHGAKQKKGNGANNKVTRTKNLLIQDHGLHAHMRNGQDKLADDCVTPASTSTPRSVG